VELASVIRQVICAFDMFAVRLVTCRMLIPLPPSWSEHTLAGGTP
jgi:hypothetical protein